MAKYYLFYEGKLLCNGKDFTSLRQAQIEQSNLIMNYGYMSDIVEEKEINNYIESFNN